MKTISANINSSVTNVKYPRKISWKVLNRIVQKQARKALFKVNDKVWEALEERK
jgi:hypothetical protein